MAAGAVTLDEMAKHYGFNVNKYASLADAESLQEKIAARNLWILGKAATEQPRPVQSDEQLPAEDTPIPAGRLTRLKALLRKIPPPEE